MLQQKDPGLHTKQDVPESGLQSTQEKGIKSSSQSFFILLCVYQFDKQESKTLQYLQI